MVLRVHRTSRGAVGSSTAGYSATGYGGGRSLAYLGTLLEECRTAGMRIDLAAALPDPAAIPPELGRHTYRVVQEGLTNASKHAPGQPVRLAVTGQPGRGLHIEIANDTSTAPPEVPVPGAGVGLIGLRERVEMLGGSLDDGTDSTGRHRLRASIPWPA